jgi:formylglycine-generating enzyme required for sulfatase activity
MEAVGTRPSDRSLYGVQDLSGNVVEWTASRMSHTGNTPDGSVVEVLDGRNESEQAWLGRSATWRVVGKGASRLHDLATVRSAFRLAMEPWTRASNVGIRLVFSLGSTAQAAAIRTPTLSA